jgi:large conductance mechanosensitive channel
MKLNLIREFKEFAIKGNMIDIAIGVIIGTAFNKVVDVLVKEIFLPPLSFLTDGINWANKKWVLREAVASNGTSKIEEIAIGYGKLFEVVVDFLIIGFTVFLVIKLMNTVRNKAQDPKDKTVVTPKNIELLNRMTELLEKQVEITERMENERNKNSEGKL